MFDSKANRKSSSPRTFGDLPIVQERKKVSQRELKKARKSDPPTDEPKKRVTLIHNVPLDKPMTEHFGKMTPEKSDVLANFPSSLDKRMQRSNSKAMEEDVVEFIG